MQKDAIALGVVFFWVVILFSVVAGLAGLRRKRRKQINQVNSYSAYARNNLMNTALSQPTSLRDEDHETVRGREWRGVDRDAG